MANGGLRWQETLRFHPIAYHLVRKAGHDDIIPLSTPIRTKSGQYITEIPVSKGQSVIASVCAYNRQVTFIYPRVFSMLTATFHPPLVFRRSGERIPMFSTRGGILTAKRKKVFPLLAFMVTS